MALNLVIALLVISLASFYIKSIFWSRFVYIVCLAVMFLRIFKLWEPTVHLLDSMTIGLGKISISVWGLTEAIIVFILLWAAAGAANRFIAHWLMTSTKLTYSDRTLLQRVIKAATVAVVILISLRAAGIHMTAIAVTGGAIGLGIGVGLQKIGSNLISGIMLLISKPIRQGDMIAFPKGFGGASWGWITQMGLNYALSWNMVTVRSIWNCERGSMIPKMGLAMSRTLFFWRFGTAFMPMGSKSHFRSATCISKAPCRVRKSFGILVKNYRHQDTKTCVSTFRGNHAFFFSIHSYDTSACADHNRRILPGHPGPASGGDIPGLAAVGVLLASGGRNCLPGVG
jgi:hypothetical protein